MQPEFLVSIVSFLPKSTPKHQWKPKWLSDVFGQATADHQKLRFLFFQKK
jgi:hypothetical protein